jgi:site-specific DNA recombinase
MKGLFAEYERTKIVERTMRGKMQTAREGRQPGGKPPYGYKLKDGKHEICEEEAKVVRMIYEWLSKDGMTLRGIQARLSKMEIPTRNFGKFWQKSVLRRLVREEAYTGFWHYNKTSGVPAKFKKDTTVQKPKPREEWIRVGIPPIISSETFQAAQRQLTRNAIFSPRNCKREYLLTGLVVCGKCGYRYAARTKNGKIYYSCNSTNGYGTLVSCDALYLRGDALELVV